MDAEPEILKRNVKRTVYVESGEGGKRVVKRFHAPLGMGRWRDGARARGEHALLAELHAAGLPVPRPLELRASPDGAPELCMEHVAGARALAEILDGPAPWPPRTGRLLRRLGELLARVQDAGLRQRDLHAGNVLVDPEGGVHLVDLTRARRVREVGAAARVEDLVRLAADVRERLSPRGRAAVFVAWWRAQNADLRARLGPRAELMLRVEDGARRRRIRTARRARARWLRTSSQCGRFRTDEGERGVVVAGTPADLARDAAHTLATAPDLKDGPRPHPHGGVRELWCVGRGARRDWVHSAWMCEHDLAVADPLLLLTGPREAAAWEVPRGVRYLTEVLPESDGRRRRSLARALGHQLGSLRDRGVTLERLELSSFLASPDGDVLLRPGERLTPASDASAAQALRIVRAWFQDATAREAAAFALGYLAANRHSRQEVDRWREELART